MPVWGTVADSRIRNLVRPGRARHQAMTLIAAVGLLALASRRRVHQAAAVPAPQPAFLSLPEAADYSGLSVMLLERLIAGGKLKAVRDAGVLKIKRLDFDNLDRLSELSRNLADAAGELRREMRRRRG